MIKSYFLTGLLFLATSVFVSAQKLRAKVSSGAHLVRWSADWSVFRNQTISVESLDGSKHHIYTTNSPRAINTNAMNVPNIDSHFNQEENVIVYVVQPDFNISWKSNGISAVVNSGSHLIKETNWRPYIDKTILVEEPDGRNKMIFTTKTSRDMNPNAMHVPNLEKYFEQGTYVHVYITDENAGYNDIITVSNNTNKEKAGAAIHLTSYKKDNPGPKIKNSLYYANGNKSKSSLILSSYWEGYKNEIEIANGLVTVDGKIIAEEIKIQMVDAPDYVFQPDYNLKTIDEVESFVNENKHLPDVPSAKDFEENGVDQSKMNKLLLQKIEELTLYMIDANKRMEKLETENKKMKELLNN
jgi:hypothetical protein